MDAMKTMADWLETVRTRRRFDCMISTGPLIASLKRPFAWVSAPTQA